MSILKCNGKIFVLADSPLVWNAISIPTVTSNLTYTGDIQSPTITGYDENTMTKGGETNGTNAGTYEITFTPKNGYQWPGGDTGTIGVGWLIYKAAGSLSLSTNSLTIDANSTTGSFTVTRAGDGAISASSNNTGVATVSVSGNTVTVTKKSAGSATITVSVAAGTNYNAPASKTCTVTCKTGTPIGSLAVGSSVYMNVDGVRTEFIVVNQGNPNTGMYDSSCDGTWLLMKDIYAMWPYCTSTHANNNAYATSRIHSSLNGTGATFLGSLDRNIRNIVKTVKIPYREGGGLGGTDQSGANGLSTKVFVLSAREVGFTSSDANGLSEEGAKLSYFEYGTGTSANNKRIAYLNGEAEMWWLRSVPTSNNDTAAKIKYDGGVRTSSTNTSFDSGIRPALILPSDVTVDTNMNVIASGT